MLSALPKVPRWLWVVLLLVGVVGLVPFECILWDGGFQSLECRLKFIDNGGKPVQGVTMTVLTRPGGVCPFYPVDEFLPDERPTSDADGIMVFHHTSRTLEFGGRECRNLLGMRFGDTESPHYQCVFTLGEREVFRTRYNFHMDEWKQFHRGCYVKEWRMPNVDIEKYQWHENEAYQAWRVRMFDGNKDGQIDRDEGIAAFWASSRLELDLCRTEAIKAGRDPTQCHPSGEVSFLLVERTIVVPNP